MILLLFFLLFLLKIVIKIIKKKKKKKTFLSATVPVTLVETGFEPGTFEFPINPTIYSDYLCMPVFLIAHNRRFNYKLFLTLFYSM